MAFKNLSLVIIFNMIAVCLAQTSDSLLPTPMAPSIVPRTSKLDLSDSRILINGNYLPNVFFFNSGSDKLDETYRPIVAEIAGRIIQNPDLRFIVRGFYSHEFDGIVSPAEGESLAKRRAEALKEAFQVFHPQLALKLEATTSGHEITALFGSKPSIYDLRVELTPVIPNWSARVIVSSDEQPYWRRGFRQISESKSADIALALARNPDLTLLFSSGKLTAPEKELASRIDVVASKFKKDMKIKDQRQIVAVYGGLSKHGEMLIDLWPSFLSPEPLNGELISFVATTELEPLRLDLSFEQSSKLHSYRIDREINDSRAPAEWEVKRPAKLAIVKPDGDKSLLLPPLCDFSMIAWSDDNSVERSNWRSVEIAVSKGYSESALVPVVSFVLGDSMPRGHWECALPQIASRIGWFVKRGGSLKMSVIGYALDFEENAQVLAESRAAYLRERLMFSLLAQFGKTSRNDLEKYLTEKGVVIQLSTQITEMGEEPPPWASGALIGLSKSKLAPLGAMSAIKWEFTVEK